MKNEELRSACGTDLLVGEADTEIIHYSSFTIHFYGITYAVNFGDAMLIE